MLLAVAMAAMAGAPAFAQGPPAIPAPGQLPPAPLAETLRAVAIATGTTIAYAPATVAGRRASAVMLAGDAAAIVRRLLAGTGLAVQRLGPRSLLVRPAPALPRTRNDDAATLPIPATGDILVTALRRPTRLADTPISMVAVRGEDLQHDRATTLADLARLAPSLAVTSAGTGFNRLSIRGAYAAGEATVALYYGNVPVAGPGGSTSDPGMMTPDLVLADVDRVEVLRGPQGTLYGTSSLAGTVRVLFRGAQLDQRSLTLDSSASLTQGGAPGASATATINLPLAAGQAALRLVGWHEYTGGVVDFPRLHRTDTDDQLREGARMALRWQLAPGWRADMTAMWQRSRIGNTHSSTAGATPNQSQGQVIVPFFDTFALASLDLHGALAGMAVDATVARSWWRPHRYWDFTQSQLNHLDDGAACAAWAAAGSCSASQMAGYNRYLLANSPSVAAQPLSVDISSAELRLSAEGTLTWTAGAFASHRADNGQSGTLPVNPATGLVRPDTAAISDRTFASQLSEYALFGDGSLRVLPWLTVSGGLRYFHYERDTQGQVTRANPFLGPFGQSTLAMSYRAHGWVGRARIEMRPVSGVLIYSQVANGFRPGGINVVPGLATDLATYRDDRLESVEIGARFAPAQRTWHLDITGFREHWADMQYAATSSDGGYAFITNIGAARINGAEIAIDGAVAPGWLARAQATITDARLIANQVSGTANTDGRAGERLPYVAPWAASVELRRQWQPGQEWRAEAGLFAHYTGRAFSAFRASTAVNRLALGGFATLNADVALERGPWRAGLFVQNIANGQGRVWAGTIGGTDLITYQRPRTMGATLQAKFH